MGDLEKGGTHDTEKSRWNQAQQTKHTCQCPLTGVMKVRQCFLCTMLASNDCTQRHVSARAEAAREVGVKCRGARRAAHVRADGVHVPGPQQRVCALQQLRRQPPQTLAAHEDDRDRPGAHRHVQRQLHPGRRGLRRRSKIRRPCNAM